MNNKLHFSDLTVTISENKFNFSTYRKSTLTDAIPNHQYNISLFPKYVIFNSILNVFIIYNFVLSLEHFYKVNVFH